MSVMCVCVHFVCLTASVREQVLRETEFVCVQLLMKTRTMLYIRKESEREISHACHFS